MIINFFNSSETLKKILQNERFFKKLKSFDNELMQIAKIWANRSYCKKRKVGAVISEILPPNIGYIVSHGYNGTLPGKENICEEKIYFCAVCGKEAKKRIDLENNNMQCRFCNSTGTIFYKMKTNSFVYHAEQNAIALAVRRGVSLVNTQIHITCSPCIECAKLIANTGIKRVVFLEKYKDLRGISFLKEAGILVEKFSYNIA